MSDLSYLSQPLHTMTLESTNFGRRDGYSPMGYHCFDIMQFRMLYACKAKHILEKAICNLWTTCLFRSDQFRVYRNEHNVYTWTPSKDNDGQSLCLARTFRPGESIGRRSHTNSRGIPRGEVYAVDLSGKARTVVSLSSFRSLGIGSQDAQVYSALCGKSRLHLSNTTIW